MSQVRAGCGSVICLGMFLAFIAGCENEYPPSLYDPKEPSGPAPEITSISPPNSALAGVTQMTISGRNFSAKKEENLVYFGAVRAEVLSAAGTELKVGAPNLVKDSISVKVAVLGSELFSNVVLYRLEPAVEEYGDFTKFDDVYGIDCDRDENLYVSVVPRKIEKVTPAGVRTVYGQPNFISAFAVRMGPGGYLYLTRSNTRLYRIPPGGGASADFAVLPGRLYDLDFDQLGNIYTAGNGNNLYLVRPDGTNKSVADYTNTFIKAVRVFNGYVYVAGRAADGQEAVWRNQIISADSLGPNEMVFDWSAKVSAVSGIASLAIAADGDIYIGTKASEAIVVVHPDGSHEPLYPGLLEPESYALSWGNGVYLYVVRRNDVDVDKRRIIRVNMQKNGAPYYGRQ